MTIDKTKTYLCNNCNQVIFWDESGPYPTWRHDGTNMTSCPTRFATPKEVPDNKEKGFQLFWRDNPELEEAVAREKFEKYFTTKLDKVCPMCAKPIFEPSNALLNITEALGAILDIGKRDMSNPKYDGYFETARQVYEQVKKGPKNRK